MSELGPTENSPEWAAARRREVEARQLLEELERQKGTVSARSLRKIAHARWPNREQLDVEFTINEAIVISNNENGSRDESPSPSVSPSGPSTVDDLCLIRVREDPDRNWKPVYEEAKRLGLFHGTTKRFIVVPWRIAKVQERKERTGHAWKKAKKTPSESAPKPEKEDLVQEEPESILDPGEADGSTRIDYRTRDGSLTVRPERGSWKLVFLANLDRKTVEQLVPLLAGIMQAGALE